MSDLTYELIGQRLKTARELSGLTQSQVANYLGIRRENISYYENGTRPIDTITLSKLADLYGYSLSYFLKSEKEEDISSLSVAFRTEELSNEDLKVLAWAKRFARNLSSIKQLLEE
ncbi:helix-turn-helix domain-containing protein [Carboxydocella sp. JDF658]|uniref:helix-turn-helix domain-containing protein n=1 Tax=Carboxydocella sp. JDF658 TaxID=1926600 RepID=UPI0009ADEB92|nr:helix-turn-helix transcriptional regulator [Carboxydocella sp. JDF658]AVX31764.1 Transcriptional regulator, contains XRE-family HTH domain [Carboxydocella thermautotrophica]GAW30614.1 HTH-type transcriptional regulator ImmR [Carboxydocella sp. JDF658]